MNMTVEEEIEMHARIKAHISSLGDKRPKLQAAMRAAAANSARVAEQVLSSGGFTKEGRAALAAAEAEYELAAKAYYGE